MSALRTSPHILQLSLEPFKRIDCLSELSGRKLEGVSTRLLRLLGLVLDPDI